MLETQLYRGTGAVAVQQPSDEPQIEVEDSREDYARIVASPLKPGFGMTLGNALRRVLLSSLQGAAVTSVRIDGIQHEFSTIPHIKEDTIEFLLNVKELRLRALADRPGTLVLDVTGRSGAITAADIQVPEHYEIVNDDLYLATVDSEDARLYVEFNVDQGRGYVPAGQVDGTTVGVIPVDAIFSPVRKVNYSVEHTRVGQATNYDKLDGRGLDGRHDQRGRGREQERRRSDRAVPALLAHGPPGYADGRARPGRRHPAAAGQVQHADRGPEPLDARVQLPAPQRPHDRRPGAREERGRAAGSPQLRPQVVRRAARALDEMNLLPADVGRGEYDDLGELEPALPLGDDEGPIGRTTPLEDLPAADEDIGIAPAPVGRRTRKSAAAAAEPAEDGEEEIPEWKRRLMELTSEEEAK